MINKHTSKLNRNEIIQEINVLGPWIHGYFNLGAGLIIEDQATLHKKRLFSTRDYFIDIISNHYHTKTLKNKTLCDIGCNTGYFLYELFKKFNFKEAIGLEPRKSNLLKAQFIADYFHLPKNKYKLKEFDILTKSNKIPIYDVIIMPGVLHHLDNHLQALRNLYKMTRELCIIETLVLTEDLNTKKVFQQLELKDSLYKDKQNKNKFGIIGYKLESNRLDGATFHNGVVGIPTTEALLMMLNHVGFQEVKIYRSEKQLRKEVYNEKSYREYHSTIVIAVKNSDQKNKNVSYINRVLDNSERKEFMDYIPLEYVEPLCQVIIGKSSKNQLSPIPYLIYDSELHYKEKRGEMAAIKLKKLIGNESYYDIIKTFKHAPKQKIPFETAKTYYHKGLLDKALHISNKLTNIINLDWRTVYKTYYLLAVINFDRGNITKAKYYNKLSLRAYPYYSLALNLNKQL